jgi:hypothetical protein
MKVGVETTDTFMDRLTAKRMSLSQQAVDGALGVKRI